MVDCARKIVEHEGVFGTRPVPGGRGLYPALGLYNPIRIGRAVASSSSLAFTMVIYDEVKRTFQGL